MRSQLSLQLDVLVRCNRFWEKLPRYTDVDMCMIIMVAANAFICFIEVTREGW